MSDVFDVSNIKVSDCPTDYVTAGAEVIIGVDRSKDGDCTVKGFYNPRTGEYHIQEVVHNDEPSRPPAGTRLETTTKADAGGRR